MSRPAILRVSAIIAAISAGCTMPEPTTQTEAKIYIDNGHDSAITVTVNGDEKAVVEPGSVEGVIVQLGECDIVVTDAMGQSIYEEAHDLTVALNTKVRPTYVLNPDQSYRYCRLSITYGDDSLARGTAAGFTNLIGKSVAEKAAQEAVGDDPQAQARWIAEQKEKQEFRNAINSMDIFGGHALSRCHDAQHVLEPVPDLVFTRNRLNDHRTAIFRIPDELYEEIKQLSAVEFPTSADFARAQELRDLAEQYVPFE